MKRYAIGDIHGGCKTFRALLKQLNLKSSGVLYLLGDYIDRGPNSKGVLDTIIQLQREGYDVMPVRGNHDDMMLRTITGDYDEFSEFWLETYGNKVLKSFGVDLVEDVPPLYTAFLQSLPYLRHDNDFVFVHAGLDVTRTDPVNQSSPEDMLWSIAGSIDSTKLSGRRLVTGHTIHNLDEIRASLTTCHIRLDNGAFTNQQPEQGNLLALDLETMELTVQPWLDGYADY